MTAATARIVIQLPPAEKRTIARNAAKAGLNLSEFLRRAARSFRGGDDDRELTELLSQTRRAAQDAMSMIDDTVEFVARSNRQIEQLKAGEVRK